MKEYFFNDTNNIIKVLKGVKRDDDLLIGQELNSDHELCKKAIKELTLDFNQTIIKLTQCSKNLINKSMQPNILYISKTIGGFSRKGIIIKDLDENENIYKDLLFVDLDEDSVNDEGLFIFAHESAHVMMENLICDYPLGKSKLHHLSMSCSDYLLAFYEGWAEQFEKYCYDNELTYKNRKDQIYKMYDAPIVLWQSIIDNNLRIHAIPKNNFIYNKAPIYKENLNMEEKIILEHTSRCFDYLKLRNIEEILSCEGFIGTIFYNINTNQKLQNNYLDKVFYEKFTIKNIESNDVKNIISPFENVILKNFYVFYNITEEIHKGSNPIIAYIEKWCELFPLDKEEIYKIFISLTIGKSVNNELSELYEQLAYYGMIGNMEKTTEYVMKYREKFNEILKLVINKQLSINNVKDEIWIENPDVFVPQYLWDEKSKVPLRINVNTATVNQLASFMGIDLDLAKEIIKKRNKQNGFNSILDVGIDCLKKYLI